MSPVIVGLDEPESQQNSSGVDPHPTRARHRLPFAEQTLFFFEAHPDELVAETQNNGRENEHLSPTDEELEALGNNLAGTPMPLNHGRDDLYKGKEYKERARCIASHYCPENKRTYGVGLVDADTGDGGELSPQSISHKIRTGEINTVSMRFDRFRNKKTGKRKVMIVPEISMLTRDNKPAHPSARIMKVRDLPQSTRNHFAQTLTKDLTPLEREKLGFAAPGSAFTKPCAVEYNGVRGISYGPANEDHTQLTRIMTCYAQKKQQEDKMDVDGEEEWEPEATGEQQLNAAQVLQKILDTPMSAPAATTTTPATAPPAAAAPPVQQPPVAAPPAQQPAAAAPSAADAAAADSKPATGTTDAKERAQKALREADRTEAERKVRDELATKDALAKLQANEAELAKLRAQSAEWKKSHDVLENARKQEILARHKKTADEMTENLKYDLRKKVREEFPTASDEEVEKRVNEAAAPFHQKVVEDLLDGKDEAVALLQQEMSRNCAKLKAHDAELEKLRQENERYRQLVGSLETENQEAADAMNDLSERVEQQNNAAQKVQLDTERRWKNEPAPSNGKATKSQRNAASLREQLLNGKGPLYTRNQYRFDPMSRTLTRAAPERVDQAKCFDAFAPKKGEETTEFNGSMCLAMSNFRPDRIPGLSTQGFMQATKMMAAIHQGLPDLPNYNTRGLGECDPRTKGMVMGRKNADSEFGGGDEFVMQRLGAENNIWSGSDHKSRVDIAAEYVQNYVAPPRAY